MFACARDCMKYIDPIESPDLHAYPIGSLVVRFVTKRNSASMISTVACNRTRSLNPARNLIDGAGTNTLVVDILIPTPPPYKLTRLSESLVNSHRAACMQINLNIWGESRFQKAGVSYITSLVCVQTLSCSQDRSIRYGKQTLPDHLRDGSTTRHQVRFSGSGSTLPVDSWDLL